LVRSESVEEKATERINARFGASEVIEHQRQGDEDAQYEHRAARPAAGSTSLANVTPLHRAARASLPACTCLPSTAHGDRRASLLAKWRRIGG